MDAKSVDDQLQKISQWLGSGSINIFGSPFAGKDTQGRWLAKALDAPLIGGGDIIRNSKNIPEHIHSIIDQGKLAPTDDFLNIITPYFSQAAFTGRPLIMSSVGRWQGEEQAIIQAARNSGHPLKAVVFLNLDEASIHNRWQIAQKTADRGHRADDDSQVISTRLEEFKTKTVPVIDFYRRAGLLIEVDGKLPPNEVTSEIIRKLAVKATED